MWYPFKNIIEKNKETEKRAKEAEQLLKELRVKIETEEALKKAKEEEKNKEARLIREREEMLAAKKDQFTKQGRPYINILDMELNEENFDLGAMELDWNQIFIQELRKRGYQGSDEDCADQWFQRFCQHVALSTYEQADSDLGEAPRVELGDGRVSYK